MSSGNSRSRKFRARRPVGRPRADGRIPDGDVREQILEAAADLFIRHGYTATTTRQIAAAAGLRQGSLRHYFQRKKDLLHELLDRTLEPAFAAFEGSVSSMAAETRLWRLLSTDCSNLVAGDQNLASLMLLPECRDHDFSDFWARREELKQVYRATIAAGIESGVLMPIDLDLALAGTFGLVESLAMWFDPQGTLVPSEAANHVARAALAALLREPGSIDAVIAASSATKSPSTEP